MALIANNTNTENDMDFFSSAISIFYFIRYNNNLLLQSEKLIIVINGPIYAKSIRN